MEINISDSEDMKVSGNHLYDGLVDSEVDADLGVCVTLDLADVEQVEPVVTITEVIDQNKDQKGIESFLDHADLDTPETVNQAKALLIDHGDVNVFSGAMQIAQEPAGMANQKQECSGCKKSIIDRFLLKALDQYWHEDCLKCSCCDCRLGEVGSTLFAKANLLLCRRDYLRLFGTTGYCSACSKMIPAFEMVMRAKNNVYHLECFACQMCNHRFCVGDRFYLCDNKILCEYDYEERMVFANMTYNYNALTQIKRQTNSLSDDLSSGYGSPSPGSL